MSRVVVQRLAVAIAAAAMVAACSGEPGAGGRRFYSIGTAGTGGLYYPIGGAFASRLASRDTGHTWTAEVTGGSVENIQRVLNGEMDLGLAIGTTVFEAYHGGQDFDTPRTELRVVAPLYPNLTHVLVRTGANVGSIADLRGRRVSVGAAGSGTEQVALQLLEAYGLDYGSVEERYLSFTESAAALADGAIDAAILSVGYPASAVLEALTTGRVTLLSIDPEPIKRLVDRHAYYSAGSIPAGSYPNQDRDFATVTVLNWIVARADFDADIVVKVLDTLDQDLDALRQAVDIAGQIQLRNLYAAPIPMHDAARKWLENRAAAAPADTARDS